MATEASSTPISAPAVSGGPPKLSPAEKHKLITQNVEEVLGGEQLRAVLEDRDAVGYWGSVTTGRRESVFPLRAAGRAGSASQMIFKGKRELMSLTTFTLSCSSSGIFCSFGQDC